MFGRYSARTHWFLAIVTFLSLVVYLLQIPETIRYTACRAYSAIYDTAGILMYFFAVAVLYEFLFRMAGASKTIQRTAVVGFIITISLTTITALWMMNQSPSNNLQNASRIPDFHDIAGACGVWDICFCHQESPFTISRTQAFNSVSRLFTLQLRRFAERCYAASKSTDQLSCWRRYLDHFCNFVISRP